MVPAWVIWVIVGAVAAVAIAFIVAWLIKFFKKSPEERTAILVSFLVGLVTIAEKAFEDEHGAGAEKLKMVEEAFQKTAPWALKLMLKLSGANDLRELIELALQKAKETWLVK